MPRIATLTPAPDYYEDWSVPQADYRRLLGEDIAFRPWADPGDLSGFDLILPLLAWGYQRDCPAWFALLDRLESLPVANPAKLRRWNSDKAYLLDLEGEGIAALKAALETAREIASKSPDAMRANKRLLNAAVATDAASGLMMESVEQQKLIGAPNQIEAIMSNLQKRAANYKD